MFKINVITVAPYLALPLICLSFDEALRIPFITENMMLRALVDNTAHGIIACWSWFAVIGLRNIMRKNIFEAFLCGILACLIDLDHFAAAKSFHLKLPLKWKLQQEISTFKDALSLHRRPPLHSTSFLILVLPCCILLSFYHRSLWIIPYLVTISVFSHHVRDAHRRGLWFWPIGSTPPIPYALYLGFITILPLLISILMSKVHNKAVVMTINI